MSSLPCEGSVWPRGPERRPLSRCHSCQPKPFISPRMPEGRRLPPPGQTDTGLVSRIHNIAVDIVGPHIRDVVVPPRPLPFCGFRNWAWRQGAGGAQGNSPCGSLSPRGIEGAHGNSLRLTRWGDVGVRQTALASPALSLSFRVRRPPGQHPSQSSKGGLVRRLNRAFRRGMPLGCRLSLSEGPRVRSPDAPSPGSSTLSSTSTLCKVPVFLRGSAAEGGHSRQLSRSFCPGMPVGRRFPRSTGQGLVA